MQGILDHIFVDRDSLLNNNSSCLCRHRRPEEVFRPIDSRSRSR